MTTRHITALKTATFFVLIAPAVWLPFAFFSDLLGVKPFERLIEEVGSFAIRFLLLALAISPLSRLLRWPALIGARRWIGVACFFYALTHVCLFAINHNEGPIKLFLDILTAPKLLIGFAALSLLLPLAITSNDRMIKRLGARRWRWLHRLVYVIAPIALLHFVLESPVESIEPMLLGGCLYWLFAYRLLQRVTPIGMPSMILLGITAALLTAAAEALFLALKVQNSISDTMLANLSIDVGLRPAQLVLAMGVVMLLISIVRKGDHQPRPRSAVDPVRAS